MGGIALSLGGCAAVPPPAALRSASIAVPDLIGVDAATAHRQLDDLELVADFDTGDFTGVRNASEWVVVDTDPGTGSLVFWGAAVRVHVARH